MSKFLSLVGRLSRGVMFVRGIMSIVGGVVIAIGSVVVGEPLYGLLGLLAAGIGVLMVRRSQVKRPYEPELDVTDVRPAPVTAPKLPRAIATEVPRRQLAPRRLPETVPVAPPAEYSTNDGDPRFLR